MLSRFEWPFEWREDASRLGSWAAIACVSLLLPGCSALLQQLRLVLLPAGANLGGGWRRVVALSKPADRARRLTRRVDLWLLWDSPSPSGRKWAEDQGRKSHRWAARPEGTGSE